MTSRRRPSILSAGLCVVCLAVLLALFGLPNMVNAAREGQSTSQAASEIAPAEADAALSDGAWDVTLGNPGPDSVVETIEVAGDWLYVGGDFYCVAGVCGYGYIARWNLITHQWESLGGGVGEGPFDSVHTTLVSPDGRYVLVGGAFLTVYNGINRQEPISTGNNPNLARYDTVNKTWQVFQTSRTRLTSNMVYDFAILNGRLYVSGWTLFNLDPTRPDNQTEGLVRWSGDPFAETLVGEWEGVGGGIYFNNGVDSFNWSNVGVLEPLGDGTLLVGGCFTQVADRVSDPPIPITVNRIAAWDPVAERWKQFGSGVRDCVLTADVSGGSITVGGRDGMIANCVVGGCTPIATLGERNADPDSLMPLIYTLARMGGKLYAGGRFNPTDHNSPARNLAVLTGSGWVEAAGGTDLPVHALATDGRYLYTGGLMHRVGSKNALYLARWDTQGAGSNPWTIQEAISVTYQYGAGIGLPSMALDAAALPHIAYFDGRTRDLIYTWLDGSQWISSTVDSVGYTGLQPAIALDNAGRPHISYVDIDNERLRYARWNGGGWNLQTVDTAGGVASFFNGSIALNDAGVPHLAYQYYDGDNAVSELRYARLDGNRWVTSAIRRSTESSALGRDASIALDASGTPHISYVDSRYFGRGDLYYTYWNGTEWIVETVDDSHEVGGSNNARGAGTSLVLVGGVPHISYFHETGNTSGNPMYACKDAKGWHTEVVSTHSDKMGQNNSLALDSDGKPHISFYNATKQILQYAEKTGATWDVQTVDEGGRVGTGAALRLDRAGNPHISYYFYLDPHNGIRYAVLPGKSLNTGQITGPALAQAGAPIVLTAAADMPGATLPITFTWHASTLLEPAVQSLAAQLALTAADHAQSASNVPIVHVVNGLTDTAAFTWDEVGAYRVSVTMVSRNGLVANASVEIGVSSIEPLYLPFTCK